MTRRVAVTGIGPVTPCGEGREAFWTAALESKNGLSPVEAPEFAALPLRSAGLLKEFKASKYVANRKSLKVMCRDIQIAVAASHLAWTDSGLTPETIAPERAGASIGAGLFNNELEEIAEAFRVSANPSGFDARAFGQSGMSQLFPLWLLKYLPNMPACHITIAHNLQGPSNTITADGSGSAAAIEEAFHLIARGSADVMLCGGAESKINAGGLLRYHKLNQLGTGESGRYDVFSESSAGIVPGEGGVILVLEELEHARARGARIYAEIASGFSCVDADPAASRAAAIEGALAEAGIRPQDVGAVHLSANGIPAEDRAEADAVARAFGAASKKPSLVASKGLTGFLGYASAAAETALAALSVHARKKVPAPANGSPLAKGFAQSAGGALSGPAVVNHFVAGLIHHVFVLKPAETNQ